jgi:hypothetical protein
MSTKPLFSAQIDSFDVHDVFDAAVLWHMFLECTDCGQLHEFPENPETASIIESLPYYHISGQRAKAQGWYVADSSSPNEVKWTILCPKCAVKRGLSLSCREARNVPSPLVLAFYQATTGRQD